MFDYGRAMKLQTLLSQRVLSEYGCWPRLGLDSVETVAGVDASYASGSMYGVAVLFDYRSSMVLKQAVVVKKPAIPYVPGLLAFREAPAYICALQKLGVKPDVVFVDGHGLAHPRGFGIATHIGLVMDTPTIGVAKKKLYGEEIVLDGEKYVRAHGHVVAKIIEHRGKQLYVSVGYRINLEDAVQLTLKTLKPQYKLPYPTAIADQLSKKIAKNTKHNNKQP